MQKFRHCGRFKKDLKKLNKNPNFKKRELENVLGILLANSSLEARHKNHKLHGEFFGCWECHIQSDVLLIYKINKDTQIIDLLRIGSHTDLF